MTVLTAVALFLVGVALLWFGAEWLVKGASALGRAMGLSSLVIGLTIVSFATSAPELVVSLLAILRGSTGISLGNVVGSNVANVGLVLGACALIAFLPADRLLMRRDIPIMLAVSVAFAGLAARGGGIGRLDGLLLLLVLAAHVVLMIHHGAAEPLPESGPCLPRGRALAYFLVGLIVMLGGADLITRSGSRLAVLMGVPDVVIGLTMVALGTSLPELAASIVGVYRGEVGLALGNVVGSNLFNLTFVMGSVAMLRPVPVEGSLLSFELPAMIAFAVVAYALMAVAGGMSRWAGILLVVSYFVFMWRVVVT